MKKYIIKRGAGDVEGQKKGKVIKFGWIEGVYVSTLFIRQGYTIQGVLLKKKSAVKNCLRASYNLKTFS